MARQMAKPKQPPATPASTENKTETPAETKRAVLDSIRALMLIRAYRLRGHLIADLDPLDMRDKTPHPELAPENYGFTDADLRPRSRSWTMYWACNPPLSAKS